MKNIIIHFQLGATRFAIVDENGIVAGVTLIDFDVTPDWKSPFGIPVPCDETVSTGDIFDGKIFNKPEPVKAVPVPTLDIVIDVLIKKAVISQKDIDDALATISALTAEATNAKV